mgnify:CR=1 FL=1
MLVWFSRASIRVIMIVSKSFTNIVSPCIEPEDTVTDILHAFLVSVVPKLQYLILATRFGHVALTRKALYTGMNILTCYPWYLPAGTRNSKEDENPGTALCWPETLLRPLDLDHTHYFPL